MKYSATKPFENSTPSAAKALFTCRFSASSPAFELPLAENTFTKTIKSINKKSIQKVNAPSFLARYPLGLLFFSSFRISFLRCSFSDDFFNTSIDFFTIPSFFPLDFPNFFRKFCGPPSFLFVQTLHDSSHSF